MIEKGYASECAKCGFKSTGSSIDRKTFKVTRRCLRCGWEYPTATETALVNKWIADAESKNK